MKRLRFFITGRVQGVGYRYFALEEGRRRGLGGFVANQPDGSVLAEAEGESEALADYAAALRRGPTGGHVEEVVVQEVCPLAETEFRVEFA